MFVKSHKRLKSMGIRIESCKSLQNLFNKPKIIHLSELGIIYNKTRKLVEMMEYPPYLDDLDDV
jgi:hypothetical protein